MGRRNTRAGSSEWPAEEAEAEAAAAADSFSAL